MSERLREAAGLEVGPWWEDLIARYQEPHRRYHTLAHLDELARWYSRIAAGPGWQAPREAAAALLFHDAAWKPGRRDNEAQSAELAREALEGSGLDTALVARHILATAAHEVDPAAPYAEDTALLLDSDLAILGAEPARFDQYQRDVLWELEQRFPSIVVSWGRRRFLRELRRRPAIYLTPWFRGQLERRARANIERSLGGKGELWGPAF